MFSDGILFWKLLMHVPSAAMAYVGRWRDRVARW
jgi:hypothetical protein